MKKQYYLFTLLLSLFCFVLMSNSVGRGTASGQGATGAPGENSPTCAASFCHGTLNHNPAVRLELADEEGNLLTEGYTPGAVYSVSVIVEADPSASRFGFQMASLLSSDDSDAGLWSDLGNGVQELTLLSRQYVEHNSPSASNTFPMKWTAPQEGSGNVKFYITGLAANGNGSPGGDGAQTVEVELEEKTISSVRDETDVVNVSVFPNPVSHTLNLQSEDSQQLSFSLFNITGEKMKTGDIKPETKVDVSALNNGLYMLSIFDQKGSLVSTSKVVKR